MARRLPHLAAQPRRHGQSPYRSRKAVRVTRSGQNGGITGQDFRESAGSAGDDGATSGKGLQRHITEGLGPHGRDNRDVGGAPQVMHIAAKSRQSDPRIDLQVRCELAELFQGASLAKYRTIHRDTTNI